MSWITIAATFVGVCRTCGGSILPGQRMRYGGHNKTHHIPVDCRRKRSQQPCLLGLNVMTQSVTPVTPI